MAGVKYGFFFLLGSSQIQRKVVGPLFVSFFHKLHVLKEGRTARRRGVGSYDGEVTDLPRKE